VRRSDGAFRLLLGPFPNDHKGALARVDEVRRVACDLDPKGIWYTYGTARIDARDNPPFGILNDHMSF
jgi:hypothetical protein